MNLTKKPIAYEKMYQKHAKPNIGGGTSNVEEKQCLSLDDMYKRMVITGQLAIARHVSSNTHGNRAVADALLKSAHESPAYIPDGKKQAIRANMAKLEKSLATKKALAERDKLIEAEVSKRIVENNNSEGFAVWMKKYLHWIIKELH